MLKKILLALMFAITATTSVTYAEDDMKTVASKAYVDTKIETKQLKIPAAGQPNVGAGETVMTYTATGNGQIGERGLYSDISSYDASTDGDKLITASALNATFTNLPTTGTTKLECANESDGCTLWTIVDQTAYGDMLPNGYTRLEYIESTGTQYINTNANMGPQFKVELDLYIPEAITSQSIYLVRSTTSSGFRIGGYSATAFYSAVGGTSGGGGIGYTVARRGIIGLSTTAKKSMGGDWISFVREWAGGGKLRLFCNAAYRLYNAKAYEDNVLIGDFIPARRDSDNKIGLYDMVSGQFFTNDGNGEDFDYGSVVQ